MKISSNIVLAHSKQEFGGVFRCLRGMVEGVLRGRAQEEIVDSFTVLQREIGSFVHHCQLIYSSAEISGMSNRSFCSCLLSVKRFVSALGGVTSARGIYVSWAGKNGQSAFIVETLVPEAKVYMLSLTYLRHRAK